VGWRKVPYSRFLSRVPERLPAGGLPIYPRNGRVAGKRTEDWAIGPLFHSLCTGCKVCEEACSTNAISVKLA
jgi:ferredoxin